MVHSKYMKEEDAVKSKQELMNLIQPHICNGLERIGRDNDGGYIVRVGDLEEADALISMGIDDDWSFEKDFHDKYRKPVFAYDFSISKNIFLERSITTFLKFIIRKSKLRNAVYWRQKTKEYKQFFRGSVRHFPKRVTDRKITETDVTINQMINESGLNKFFLKIDIEGYEYRLIQDIISNHTKITGLVIEFHDVEHLRDKFMESMTHLLTQFNCIHVHSNNHSFNAKDGIPNVLEISFTKKDKTQYQKVSFLPSHLDQPNNPDKPEYEFNFID